MAQQTPKKTNTKTLVKPLATNTFKTDSINFRKDLKSGDVWNNIPRQNKMIATVKKYGAKKLTGKESVNISDMSVQKKGGQVKSKSKK